MIYWRTMPMRMFIAVLHSAFFKAYFLMAMQDPLGAINHLMEELKKY